MNALYDAKISMQTWSFILFAGGAGLIIFAIISLMLTKQERQAFYIAIILILLVLIFNKLLGGR